MEIKKAVGILLIAVLIAIISKNAAAIDGSGSPITFSAAKCFPEYECGVWGECVDGLHNRVCTDKACGRREIIERKFCDLPGCKAKIECTEWSQCIYVDKVTSIISSNIRFGGYQNRICRDTGGCVESFTEEKPCEEFYPLQLEKAESCNEEFLAAIDPASQREVARINLNSWRLRKLDITLVQGETNYCPICYDGVKDGDEEKIDCGGECKPCTDKRTMPAKLPMITFWLFSALFSLLFIRELILMRKAGRLSL